MISSFLKKLLFARQFFIIDGKIEVLGKKQVMLPSDVICELQKINSRQAYNTVKKTMTNDLKDYAKKLGSGEEGMLKNVESIFETFGLGKLQIVDLDNKNKRCAMRLHGPSLVMPNNLDEFGITPAILAGIFSFLFDKDVDAKQTKPYGKGFDYCEYTIK